MKRADLDELSVLAEAHFQHEQAKMHGILAEEADLREALAQLEDRHRRAREARLNDPLAQGVFGGDVMWQGWVCRSRQELQMRLAQVLARKSTMMRGLARAHGKKTAAETLAEAASAEGRMTAQKARNEELLALFVLRSGLNDGGV